jgi:hypothetical protein
MELHKGKPSHTIVSGLRPLWYRSSIYGRCCITSDLDALNEMVEKTINDTAQEVESIEKSLKALASSLQVADVFGTIPNWSMMDVFYPRL